MIEGVIKARHVHLYRIAEEFSNIEVSVERHRRSIQNFINTPKLLKDKKVAAYILATLTQQGETAPRHRSNQLAERRVYS